MDVKYLVNAFTNVSKPLFYSFRKGFKMSATAHKFHGIQLALNSNFTNLVIEHLAADPLSTDAIPLVDGRVWFNTVSKNWKYCDIDAGGALRINTFSSAEALAAAVSSINTSITNLGDTSTAAVSAEVSRAQAAEATLTSNLAQEVSDRTNADSAESTARIAGDATVSTNFAAADAVVAANASTALAAEASTRLSADNALTARDDGIQTEVDLIETSLGLNADGSYTAPANTTYLGAVANQKAADIALDTAIATEVARAQAAEGVNADAITAEAAARTAGDSNLQTQLTAYINTQVTQVANTEAAETVRAVAAESAISAILSATDIAVGLNTNGTMPAFSGTNYLDSASTVTGAEILLDTAVKANAVAIAAEATARTNADVAQVASVSAEVTARTNADTDLQTQITSIETGAGLNGDGTYKVPTGTNYLNSTTTLGGADAALDTAVKVNADAITAINTVAIPNLQSQVTAEVTRATGAEASEATARAAAVSTLTTNLAAEVTRATGAESTLTTNLASEVTRATGAESGLQTQINALVASAGDGTVALTAELNAKRYTYMSSAPALVHTVTHNLGTPFYSANIMVQGSDNIWRNDIMPVQDVDNNSYTITLTESSMVKASGQSNAAL